MKLLHLAAAVLNQTPLDWHGNASRILKAVRSARAQRATVLCLPELCITGYGCEDAFLSSNTCQRAWATLQKLLPETRGLIVAFGLPVLHQNAVFNCVALAVDGRLLGLVAKRHLAGDGLHYEPRWFKAWPVQKRDIHITPEGESIPIGDLLFDVGGIRIGFEICEDAWVAQRPGVLLAAHGADLILNPSASHFAFGKTEIRKRFVLEGSRAFGVSYIYANLVGNEAGRAIYDGDAMIASGGRLIAEGPRFTFEECRVTTATVDVELTRLMQARTASHRPSLITDQHLLVSSPFLWPDISLADAPPPPTLSDWEHQPRQKHEEFSRAAALGLFDYMRKSRSRGFIVSLSGGADSAAISCLVALMVEFAVDELGVDRFVQILSSPGWKLDILSDGNHRKLVRQLLTTAYQSTDNSGPVTKQAAFDIAEALGAHHYELDVSAIHQAYVSTIEHALGRQLEWKTDDIALQNIQARVRSPGIWMLANINGALLLSTSNRSEAAVGYATMDGDTSGGLAPIAGIDKAWLREWLSWMETEGPLIGSQTFAIPTLRAVNVQQPTAELRPPDQAQTDENDLMPYPLLDAIERAAIRDKQGPMDVFKIMRVQFPDIEAAQLGEWTDRFFRLWSRNQWKRERYAPSFHYDDENLDPKTWCRWPILSGGFEIELAELRNYLSQNPAL
ncbi:NAD(+) synthase [Phragmitibacter flavus]|uniref:Glutamine-dependent NAD(+) synthetase n=1 Tax=Phragmitibacter flavus TaxID=2576071 RepID=A0A5R8KGU1_9BACT|nr:NAD(+) synthase [Phragmitibacter flavus]TLD70819.1 NAD(+) synthase [Phragmitibacter flavus]